MKLKASQKIFGKPILPGDKSISHRSLILASIAEGVSTFKNMSEAQDVLSTEKVLLQLGIEIQRDGTDVRVISIGKYKKPIVALDCGNAGTLMRLMTGVLAGQEFESTLIGDESLSQRPMKRVLDPLLQMGAQISLRENQFAPIQIHPSKLKGLNYNLTIPSAQVKSAILLAGLYTDDNVIINGNIQSRDHSERLLKFFGADIEITDEKIRVSGNNKLRNVDYNVPNDISAASFWIAAGLLATDSEVNLENVGINPTRMGFIDVLKKSGAKIEISETVQYPEPVASIKVKNSKLSSFVITKDEVPYLIDEVPLLALIATQCDGVSTISGLEELRYKESDRIESTINAILALGGKIEVHGNDLKIPGNQILSGGVVDSLGDHRIAMMAAVSKYCCTTDIEIKNFECAEISDPYFAKQISEFL
jgi:3-phosphoshikimate 1-carboxyvinyltransferase